MLTNVVLPLLLMAQNLPLISQMIPVFPDGFSADGTTHTTTLVMQNPSLFNGVSCNITFYGAVPAISTLEGRIIRSTVIQLILPAGGFNVLKSTAATGLSTGFARLDCSSPVAAFAMYSVFTTGEGGPILLSETTMPSAVEATGFQFINDSRDGGRLAVAFANENAIGTVVQMTVGDLLGRTILVANIVVPRYATLAKFVDEIAPNLPRNHVGTVVFRSVLRVSAAGLRFNGASVTSISPTAQVQ